MNRTITPDAPPEHTGALPDREATAHLKTAEMVSLWTIRAWAQTRRRHHDAGLQFDAGLKQAGCPEAARAFATLLEIVNTAARRKVQIHTPTCPRVSEDEKRLLHILAAQQTGHTLEAFDVLTHLLPGAAVRIALGHAEVVAAGLAGAGLHLPDRAWNIAELSLTHRLRAPRTGAACVRYQLH